MDAYLFDDLARFVGQTVTVFTTSGGISGGGFTGVLISIDAKVTRLMCDVGLPPSCPIGSDCNCLLPGYGGGYGGGYGYGGYNSYGSCGCNKGFNECGFNPLGCVTVIPIHAIAAFSHHAI